MNTNFKKTLLATAVLSATCMTQLTVQAQQTEDEMIERDLTWLTALSKCAKKVDDAAKWVQDKQTYK